MTALTTDEQRRQSVIRSRRSQRKKQTWLNEYKAARGCTRCKEPDPVVLQFDHLVPAEKHPKLRAKRAKNGNTYLRTAMWMLAWADIFVEVDKCQILCANCHIRTEAERRR